MSSKYLKVGQLERSPIKIENSAVTYKTLRFFIILDFLGENAELSLSFIYHGEAGGWGGRVRGQVLECVGSVTCPCGRERHVFPFLTRERGNV